MSAALKVILVISLLINLVAVWGLFHYIWYGGSPIGELKRIILGDSNPSAFHDPFYQENQLLSKEAAAGKFDSLRVVFLGASITRSWDLEKYFPEIHPINRGIGGLAPSLLARFKENVIDLKPRAVVIKFCSINITNRIPLYSLQNIMQMLVQLAQDNNIIPIVCTIIPPGKPSAHIGELDVIDSLRSFNTWLKEFAAMNSISIVDLAAEIEDQEGYLPRAFSRDPVHLNQEGYEVISHAARPRINEILGIEKN
jgi:hypothetical protein